MADEKSEEKKVTTSSSSVKADEKRKIARRIIKDKTPHAQRPYIILTEQGLPQARFETEEELKKNLKRFIK